MVPIATLLDVAFLGHLSDVHHLAGVAIAALIFNYLYWSFGFLRMATTGLTAQAVGRGDPEAVALVGLRHGFVAIAVGFAIILCRGEIWTVGFALFQAAPEVTVSGQLYFDMMVWGAPATLLCYVCIGWLLGQSKSSWVLILAIVSNLSKVALDYFLIVQLNYASAGAASAIAATITAVVALVMVLQLSDWRSVLPKFWAIDAFRDLFSLNAATGVRTFALLSVFALFTQMSVRLGTEILTANTLILEVLSLAAYFIDGFAFATETYAGLFYSRGEWERMKTLLILSGSCCLACGLLFAIAFTHFPMALFGLLTNHSEIVAIAAQSSMWLIPILGFASVAYMLDGYFLGLSAGKVLRDSSILAALCSGLVLAIGGYFSQGMLLWLGLVVLMMMRSLSLGWYLKRSFDLEGT